MPKISFERMCRSWIVFQVIGRLDGSSAISGESVLQFCDTIVGVVEKVSASIQREDR